LVAISVLLAILCAAVFAQDDEGKWKFGFMAQYVSSMFYATSASGKSELKGTDMVTQKQEFGKYNKGTMEWFPNRKEGMTGIDNRLLLSVSNSGENYDVYADIAFDDWAQNWGGVMNFLNKGSADWYAKGTAGIFNGQIGTQGYGGFVSTQATWNGWYDWNTLCRFGVWRPEAFIVGDDFRTWDEWGNIVAVGMALGDNFKFSLGYRFEPNWDNWNPPAASATESKSSINGSFMLNGRAGDAIAFDLFYSIIGSDPNTFERNRGTPDGGWGNTLGAYIGINGIDNLGLSFGYTANFNVYDKGSYGPDGGDWTKSKERSYTAPIYSGIDIHASFSGIDKIGLTFNNNLTFASVKGKGTGNELSEHVLGLEENIVYGTHPWGGGNSSWDNVGEGSTQDWFHWETELKASLALIENVNLVFHLGDRLGVRTDKYDANDAAKTTATTTKTNNKFRAVLSAEYGAGSVTFGAGLFFQLESDVVATETKATILGSEYKSTYNGNLDTITFGIPIMFKVAF